jgi:carbon storage regulator
MLVLSRHRDETVCIGDEIRVLIVDIRGDKVRLGIEAPVNLPVHRLEIYERLVQERKDEPKQGDADKGDAND